MSRAYADWFGMRAGRRGVVAAMLLCGLVGCSSRKNKSGMTEADDHAMQQGRAKLLMSSMNAPQQAGSQQSGARPTSTPYAGDLSIFEYPGRDKKLQIDRVMTLLGMRPGKNVADLGAGSGWFTVRAARRVAPGGTVFAEDINPASIQYIDDRAAKEKLGNVRAVLGTPDDPKLPPDSVDAVLMLKMYHEIAHPETLLALLKPALRPGAKVGIIDRNGNGSGTDHGVQQAIVVKEMGEAGFALAGTYDFTKADGEDYFLIFRVK